MTTYNRFSVQILGTVDATSTEDLLMRINAALGSIPKFKIKAVSHDKWVDGYTGDDRIFGDDGKEIVEQPEVVEEVVERPSTTEINGISDEDIEVLAS